MTHDQVSEETSALCQALKSDKLRVTPESFAADYGMWEQSIAALQPYDAEEIHHTLDNIDVDELPELGDLTDADIYDVYRRQHKVKKQLMMMRALVDPHVSFNTEAMKLLKDLASQLFDGTVKDKEAQSSNVVKAFTLRAMMAKAILKRIDTHIELLDFSSTQVARAMRDSQQADRLNVGAMDRARNRGLTKRVEQEEDMYLEAAKDGELEDLPAPNTLLNVWSNKGRTPSKVE